MPSERGMRAASPRLVASSSPASTRSKSKLYGGADQAGREQDDEERDDGGGEQRDGAEQDRRQQPPPDPARGATDVA